MKLWIKAVCVLMILACTVSYGQETRYRVIIKSVVPGAKVYLNDKHRAETPCGFSAGENFKIKISLQKDGYKTWSNIYTVKNDILINQELIPESSELNYSKEYFLSLASEPDNAYVYINDELKGQTPFNASIPSWSKLNITVRNENYQDWNETILMSEQFSERIRLKSTSKSKKKPWYIAGAAIVGGGVVAYFATQKDNGGSGSTNWPQPPARPN